MRLLKPSACVAALLATLSSADTNDTKLSSKQILPNTFRPPPVFENVNLVRTLNLERIYPRETINVAIRNIGQHAEEYYYIPFEGDTISRVGGVTARDKSKPNASSFEVEQVEYDPYRYTSSIPTPDTRSRSYHSHLPSRANNHTHTAQPNTTASPSRNRSPRVPSKP